MNFAAKTFPVAFSTQRFTTANFPLKEANREHKEYKRGRERFK